MSDDLKLFDRWNSFTDALGGKRAKHWHVRVEGDFPDIYYVLWGPSPADPTMCIAYMRGSVAECRKEMAYRIRTQGGTK